jgi:hypothetical protein
MTYNLRTSSLVGPHLDAALIKNGAATFGTTQRKQARLNRFLEVNNRDAEARQALHEVIVEEQQKVQTRSRQRVLELLNAYLGY